MQSLNLVSILFGIKSISYAHHRNMFPAPFSLCLLATLCQVLSVIFIQGLFLYLRMSVSFLSAIAACTGGSSEPPSPILFFFHFTKSVDWEAPSLTCIELQVVYAFVGCVS